MKNHTKNHFSIKKNTIIQHTNSTKENFESRHSFSFAEFSSGHAPANSAQQSVVYQSLEAIEHACLDRRVLKWPKNREYMHTLL